MSVTLQVSHHRVAIRNRLVAFMRMRTVGVARVFTRGDAGGNLLGVVTDPSGLDGTAMQRIAADLGYSETIFIAPGQQPAVRIFTPAVELPFAGHPLVGAAWWLGGAGTLECGIGRVEYRTDGDLAFVDVPLSRDVARTDATSIAVSAGLPRPQHGWWVRMPLPYLIIEVDDSATVLGARVDIDALRASEAGEATMLIARGSEAITARFFAPGLGVEEDPATGSAAVALASVMVFEGAAEGWLRVEQGDVIGHPSTIHVTWQADRAVLSGSVRREADRHL